MYMPSRSEGRCVARGVRWHDAGPKGLAAQSHVLSAADCCRAAPIREVKPAATRGQLSGTP